MARRFYLTGQSAGYSPATIRGTWDKTSDSPSPRHLATSKAPYDGGTTNPYTGETSASNTYTSMLYRGVTEPLAAGTIGTGTVNVMIAVGSSNPAMNAHWHLHIYVTQGDSDTPRGTLLSDYTEPAGTNELSASPDVGTALNAAASLSSVAISAGDRIVVEVGFVARNTDTTTYYSGLTYGSVSGRPDLSAGGSTSSGVPWIEFSEDLLFNSSSVGRVTRADVDATFAEATAPALVTRADVDTTFAEATAPLVVTRADVDVVMTDPYNPQRITQMVAEMARGETLSLRATQLLVELLTPTVTESRVTQVIAELLYPTTIESRVTQALAEIGDAGVRETRVTQHVIELLAKVSTYCGPPSLSPAPLCGKPDVLAWLEWTVPLR